MRNEVIEKFINCETLINGIICQYFFKRVEQNFWHKVLYDDYFSFGLKINILKKIIKDEVPIQKLRRMSTIRNIFVHRGQKIIKVGTTEEFVPDPNNPEAGIDFEKLYEEFLVLEEEIVKFLFEKFKELGGIAEEKI